MKSFVNNWLALPYSLEDLGADVITLTSIERSKAVRYLKNEIPKAVRALTIGADVQTDRIYWKLIGWNTKQDEDGSIRIESWDLSWGECGDFDTFDREILRRDWTHESGAKMRIVCGAIDGRYRSAEVKAFCATHPQMSVVFGEQTIRSSASTSVLPFHATQIDRDSKGKPLLNSRTGYRINTIYWKQWLYQRMNKIGDHVVHHLPANDDKDARLHIRHMMSEIECSERVRGSTAIKRVWKVRKGYEANHWLDCTVYASAIANIKGIFGMSEDSPIIGEVKAEEATDEKEKQKVRPRIVERRSIR